MTRDIDSELRDYARRWGQAQPPAPSLPAFQLGPATPRRPRRRPMFAALAAAITVAVLAAVLVAVSFYQTSRTAAPPAAATSSSAATPQTRATLRRIADQLAESSHSVAVSVHAVLTTYAAATALSAHPSPTPSPGSEPDATKVWLMEITGSVYYCNSCDVPPGAPTPHGTVVHLTVDAATLTLRDYVYDDRLLDLSSLGDVITLLTPSVDPS